MSIKSRLSVILMSLVPDYLIRHHNRPCHWIGPAAWRPDSLTRLNDITKDYPPERKAKARRQYLLLLRNGIPSKHACRLAIVDSRS